MTGPLMLKFLLIIYLITSLSFLKDKNVPMFLYWMGVFMSVVGLIMSK